MANEKNLKHKLTVSEQRKGGIASARARRERRTVKEILSVLLSDNARSFKHFEEIASRLGLSKDSSIKEVFTYLCVFNSADNADLEDLNRLAQLLGEDDDTSATVLERLDKVLAEVNRLAQ